MVKIEITSLPKQTVLPVFRDRGTDRTFDNKIKERKVQKVVEEAEPSNRCLFLRPTKDGDFRPILNLSKLNEYVIYRHFKMEQLNEVMQLVHRGGVASQH